MDRPDNEERRSCAVSLDGSLNRACVTRAASANDDTPQYITEPINTRFI